MAWPEEKVGANYDYEKINDCQEGGKHQRAMLPSLATTIICFKRLLSITGGPCLKRRLKIHPNKNIDGCFSLRRLVSSQLLTLAA